jgi:hypothetical protein
MDAIGARAADHVPLLRVAAACRPDAWHGTTDGSAGRRDQAASDPEVLPFD